MSERALKAYTVDYVRPLKRERRRLLVLAQDIDEAECLCGPRVGGWKIGNGEWEFDRAALVQEPMVVNIGTVSWLVSGAPESGG